MLKKDLKYLIREEVRRLLEQETQPDKKPEKAPGADKPKEAPSTSSAPTPTDIDTDTDASATPPESPEAPDAATTGDMEAPIGDDIGGLEGMEDTEDTEGTSSIGDFGGGGFSGGGGWSGGGGGGSMDTDTGDDTEAPEDASSDLALPTSPEIRPDDPVGAAVDEAKKALKTTEDPAQILSAIKASIQSNFQNYDDAWPIVSQLRAMNNRALDGVINRLIMFLVGI